MQEPCKSAEGASVTKKIITWPSSGCNLQNVSSIVILVEVENAAPQQMRPKNELWRKQLATLSCLEAQF